jgi:hypothetical protein
VEVFYPASTLDFRIILIKGKTAKMSMAKMERMVVEFLRPVSSYRYLTRAFVADYMDATKLN